MLWFVTEIVVFCNSFVTHLVFCFWDNSYLTLHVPVGTIVSLAVFPIPTECYAPFLACNTRNLSLIWLYPSALQCIWEQFCMNMFYMLKHNLFIEHNNKTSTM